MDYRLPDLGEGVNEAEFGEWLVQVGETVQRGQALAEVMTDKAVIELPAPFEGTIVELKTKPGDFVRVGSSILCYTAESETPPAADEEAEGNREDDGPKTEADPRPIEAAADSATSAVGTHRTASAAPAVRRLASRLGIDLEQIAGTGPDGRIVIDDLAAALETPTPAASPTKRSPVSTDYGTAGERIPFRGVRRKIAERMVQSKQTIPHYAYVDECDVTELVRLRKSLTEPFERRDLHLTYLPFFVKAVVGALREVPLINSSLEEDTEEIVLHDRYHIGIAMHTPRGLIVPVLRDANTLGIPQLARRIEELTAAARGGEIPREDLIGGTFTITSLGRGGGLISTPIINPPEAGILGIGRIETRPVYDEFQQIRPAEKVFLSFSFDHRIVDGALGAIFANAVIQRLETPARLLLDEEAS